MNMWKHPKYLRNLDESTFIMFFIILREVDLENVSPSVRWNRRVVCEYIDIWWQVSCSRLGEFQLSFETQLSEKQKPFSNFLFQLWILYQILNILKEKMIVIANVFPKLQTLKIFVRKLSQEHRFRTGFGSKHEKASHLLSKSPTEWFYHVLLSF